MVETTARPSLDVALPPRPASLRPEMADSGKLKKDENGLFRRRFFRHFSYYLNMLHSYHSDRAATRECGVPHPKRKATFGCENGPPPPYPPRLRGRVGWGEGRVRWRSGRECPRRF